MKRKHDNHDEERLVCADCGSTFSIRRTNAYLRHLDEHDRRRQMQHAH